MTQPDKYNLNWETFSSHITGALAELRLGGAFADVTLVSEDRVNIKAHKEWRKSIDGH